jgi:hypothetical protein
VNNVGCAVVFAAGNEDLAAFDLERAVRLRDGLGFHRTQVAAGLRFGEAHGAGPFAGAQFGQIGVFLLLIAVGQNRLETAGGEAREQRKADVGRAGHFLDHLGHGVGQAQAAVFGRIGQADITVGGIAVKGFLKAVGQAHRAIRVALAALGITGGVERKQFFLAELGRGFDHFGKHFRRGIGEGRNGFSEPSDFEYVVEYEIDLFEGRAVAGHPEAPEQ